ncbi:hypothetical protein HID58_082396 [Brassica napus]|uniref:HMA domain-containing protein n=1 Tax=Brassica napus TaxID=3708 RepID=A0ABQ7YDK7_BRANA|nr:hypothetical protein HID58_082396 [Brassica napus]
MVCCCLSKRSPKNSPDKVQPLHKRCYTVRRFLVWNVNMARRCWSKRSPKNNPGKYIEAEVLTMTKKSDVVPEKNGQSNIVPKKEANPEIKQTDDKPERSIREVEYNLRPASQELEVYIRKVISKFEGVENCVVDIQNKRIVVTGDFDQKKLFEKLQKKRRKIIKKDHELIEKYRSIHARVRSGDEKEMAKFDMSNEENPNGALNHHEELGMVI